jgi:iron complex outermembrane recepter protein
MFRHAIINTSALVSLVVALASAPAYAADNGISTKELLNLSLEQLSNMEITSVSKRSEKATEAAAAIFVINQDDIRRSGATSIPDLLRMVPGIDVAQASAHQWAISSRGFNDHFANKLLVLIDGRSVYTPLFSGVYWDVQDTVLEDIERIEVIRGPGATLWGANAVNGVINIITKSAKNTQGGMAAFSAGNYENGLSRVRYGAKISENAHIRGYAKYDNRESTRTTTGADSNDPWNKSQAGFRADWQKGESHSYTFQGDVYRSGKDNTRYFPTLAGAPYITIAQEREVARGGNLLGRWNYRHSKDSDLTVQMYYDNAQRDTLAFSDTRQTFDFDFQHAWNPNARHEVVWGGGYRLVKDDIIGTFFLQMDPPSRSDNLFSAFVQDKIAIVPDKFFITLGSKFEHNDYTGFEYQPSGRFTWLINNRQTLWGSVARAVRTPNRFADDGRLLLTTFPQGGPAVYVATTGLGSDTESEELTAYEIGYRINPRDNLSFDLTAYYNSYHSMITNSLGAPTVVNIPGFGATPVLPISPVNGNSGRTYGFEAAAKWDITQKWQTSAAYTFMDFKLDASDGLGFTFAGRAPEQQFNVRSSWQLPHNLEFSAAGYYVDELSGLAIPDYVRVDARLAWKPLENLEVSLVGQNLLDPHHPEFNGYVYQDNAQIPRSIYANVNVKF